MKVTVLLRNTVEACLYGNDASSRGLGSSSFCNGDARLGVKLNVTFDGGPCATLIDDARISSVTRSAALVSELESPVLIWWKSLPINRLFHFRALFDGPKNSVVTSQVIWLRR